jgi:hypothetical protein
MKVQGITALMLTLSGTAYWFHAYALEPGMPASSACAVTNPKGGTVENDSLAVALPDTDTLIFKPGGPGFVDVDGALGIKFGWDVRKKGDAGRHGAPIGRQCASGARVYQSQLRRLRRRYVAVSTISDTGLLGDHRRSG